MGSEELLDTDHRPVLLSIASLWGRCPRHTAKRRQKDRCGKWKLDTGRALHACNSLASNVELNEADLSLQQITATGAEHSVRAVSCRYKDPPKFVISLPAARNCMDEKRENVLRKSWPDGK